MPSPNPGCPGLSIWRSGWLCLPRLFTPPTHWLLNRWFGAGQLPATVPTPRSRARERRPQHRRLCVSTHKAVGLGGDVQPDPRAASSPARRGIALRAQVRPGSGVREDLLRSLSALLALLLQACPAKPDKLPSRHGPKERRFLDLRNAGLRAPASAVWDATADVYLVSNIHGHPLDQDDNGFISHVRPNGAVEELKWIDGAESEVTLHAPKGLAVVGDNCGVAASGSCGGLTGPLAGRRAGSRFRDTSFLNGVTSAGDGRLLVTVLVTDTGWQRDRGIALAPGGKPGLVAMNPETGEVNFRCP